MPRYQAISKPDFLHLRWKRYENYRFAAQDAVVPLVAQELPRACMSLPIAFTFRGDALTPVAVQGLKPGQNLYVTADGRWVGSYVPAVYRGYPFAMASTDDGQQVLCVDMDSGLVGEEAGELFFDEQGEPSQAVRDVLNFLQQVHANAVATTRMCAALQAEGLIVPWSIVVKGAEGDRPVQGLHRIDEAKWNSLDAEALYRLHQAGAVAMVFCQLLSMQHLQTLGKLTEMHGRVAEPLPVTESGELDLSFLTMENKGRFGPH